MDTAQAIIPLIKLDLIQTLAIAGIVYLTGMMLKGENKNPRTIKHTLCCFRRITFCRPQPFFAVNWNKRKFYFIEKRRKAGYVVPGNFISILRNSEFNRNRGRHVI